MPRPSQQFVKLSLLAFLLFWLVFFIAKKIDLTTTDLGRHIKNGEIILQSKTIAQTNFYSYTEPNFASPNHHWLSGVLFYLVWGIGGFSLLSLLYIALMLLAFLLFFSVAKKESGFKLAWFISLLVIPLIAQRAEIRPEGFSYFFIAVFFWILWHWRAGFISKKWLIALPLGMIFWVNLHIYFFFGLVLLGALFLEELALSHFALTKKVKIAAGLLAATVLASMINPLGVKLALYPFMIFQNYGYRIVENQSVWFLQRVLPGVHLIYFQIIIVVLVTTAIAAFFIKKKKFPIFYVLLAITVSVMAFMALRNFTLFGLLILPVLAYNLRVILGRRIGSSAFTAPLITTSFLLVIISFFIFRPNLPSTKDIFGIGLLPGNDGAAKFFKELNLRGLVFNNYDIGGYLIYYLYPAERIFTDNRPESYSTDFFNNIYIPMQENDDIWKRELARYNFNAIVFSHRDYTPWGQKFLIARVQDPEWAPIFVDSFGIIFLRRNDSNKELIVKYEIPRFRFRL